MSRIANATTEPDEHEEIEITEEMIEVGFRVLARSGISDDPLEADKLLIAEIYRAMFAHRPRACYEQK